MATNLVAKTLFRQRAAAPGPWATAATAMTCRRSANRWPDARSRRLLRNVRLAGGNAVCHEVLKLTGGCVGEPMCALFGWLLPVVLAGPVTDLRRVRIT